MVVTLLPRSLVIAPHNDTVTVIASPLQTRGAGIGVPALVQMAVPKFLLPYHLPHSELSALKMPPVQAIPVTSLMLQILRSVAATCSQAAAQAQNLKLTGSSIICYPPISPSNALRMLVEWTVLMLAP